MLIGCAKPSETAQVKPNILLFLSDDLSWHDLGCYGNEEVSTPNLDQLAWEGLRFEYCFNSAPMCAPTRMSLYTGIHPVRNGAHPNHSFVYPDVKSIPHYLEPLGYRVALLGKKHYQPEENFPFEWLGGLSHDSGKDEIDLDISQVDTFINRKADQPWCLIVASNQSHMPWNRGDPTAYSADELTLPPYMVDTPETREAMTRYYAEITYMDDQLGQCLDILEQSGQKENTLVIYLSEQGS
ncbi:MAG: sulfatase-like hydrolase/transferase, partial [Verrucomicrobia bacterium]|nr:sulfatase-like hydrolase/transferase [Verrucomicrobiota bacterium]